MKKIISVLLLAASLAAVQAQGIVTFTVNMTGGQAVPPTGSLGTGTGWAFFDTALNTIWFNVTYANLTDAPTRAYFWEGPPGAIGTPLIAINVIPGDPPNQGTLATTHFAFPSGSFGNLMTQNTYLTLGASSGGGLATGEIRGQLVPEPATLSIAGLGLGLVALFRGRRKQ